MLRGRRRFVSLKQQYINNGAMSQRTEEYGNKMERGPGRAHTLAYGWPHRAWTVETLRSKSSREYRGAVGHVVKHARAAVIEPLPRRVELFEHVFDPPSPKRNHALAALVAAHVRIEAKRPVLAVVGTRQPFVYHAADPRHACTIAPVALRYPGAFGSTLPPL